MRLPLVLLHGWGVNAAIWNPILDDLKCEREVIVLDFPGYGNASHYSGAYTLDAIVNEVLTQAPEKADWVGWSLGATVAMSAAISHPERFGKLQLISPTPCFTNQPDWKLGTDIEPFENFANDFEQNYEKAIGKFLLLQFLTGDRPTSSLSRGLIRDLKKRLLPSTEPSDQTLRGGLDILRQTDLRPLISELKIETQIVAGQGDHVVPVEASQFLFDHLPTRHSIHRFETGHLPFLQEPREYIEDLHQFLQPSQ